MKPIDARPAQRIPKDAGSADTASRKRKQRVKVPASERATLTIEETAHYLGIGRQTAYDEARTGGLPILRLGRRKKRIVVVRVLLDEMLLKRGRESWTRAPIGDACPSEAPVRESIEGQRY